MISGTMALLHLFSPKIWFNASLDRWAIRGLQAISIVLVVGISYSLAKVTWFLIEPGGAKTGVAPSINARVQNQTESTQLNDVDIEQLQAMNLFGKVGAIAIAPKVVKPVKVPETTLQLELEGVFRSEVPEGSTAIVAERGKTGKLYRVGERLPGNAVLDQVFADRVLLNRSGSLETLRFPELKGVTATKVDQSSGRKSQALNRGAANRRSSLRANSSRDKQRSDAKTRVGQMLYSGSRIQPDELLKTFTEEFQASPKNALEDLGVQVVAPEKGGGYVVSKNIPANLLRASGLRYGDIIRSVNGQPLGNTVSDQALYQQIQSRNEVTVEVERGSRRFTVTVPVPK